MLDVCTKFIEIEEYVHLGACAAVELCVCAYTKLWSVFYDAGRPDPPKLPHFGAGCVHKVCLTLKSMGTLARVQLYRYVFAPIRVRS